MPAPLDPAAGFCIRTTSARAAIMPGADPDACPPDWPRGWAGVFHGITLAPMPQLHPLGPLWVRVLVVYDSTEAAA